MVRFRSFLLPGALVLAAALPAAAQDRRAVTPVAPVEATRVTPTDSPSLRVFAPSSDLRMASVQPDADLPRPSILLGIRAQARVFDAALETGEAEAELIAWDNLAARSAMRDEDPEIYARLVAAGAFDPPEAALPRALQTELARMNCYTAGIDGVWGAGSRRSVARYVEAGGAEAPTDAATIALWRHLVAAEDVICPDVVAPVAARSEPVRPRATRSTQTRSEPSPTVQAQPTQPSAATPSRRGFGSLGGGVIR